MTKPTKATMSAMKEDLLKDLHMIRDRLNLNDPEIDRAWAGVETFCNISMRVLAKTNLSKIRDESRTVEIAARMAGRTVFSD